MTDETTHIARQAAAVIEVKPLDWHKSHMPNWNGDYHTVPTGYSVRCADENGWKWSGLGAHGYRSTPSAAKGEAQADHERRILSQIVARPSLAGDERVAEALAVVAAVLQAEVQRKGGETFSGTWRLPAVNWRGTVSDALDAADAALSAMNTPAQEGEWQPIETAPKEGTDVLVWFDHDADPYQDPQDPNRITDYAVWAEGAEFLSGSGVCVARWFPQQWETTDEYGGGYWLPPCWCARENNDWERAVNATHWMPLPAPPAAMKDGG